MAIDPRRIEIGDRVPNTKWVVRGKLGEGGMGVVLEVVKPPGIVGAMKIMLPDLAERREFIDSFLNEVRIQVSLRHDHIVQVFDFEELEDGTLFFIMEKIEGSTLRQTLRKFGNPIPPPHVHEITCQISEALDRAHSKGVVHRDLKLENVFLHSPEESGKVSVKVGDFGIAVLAHGKRIRGVFGTPKSMSPEQFRGDRVTLKADIYALGLMTYEMLTGHLPWERVPDDINEMRDIVLHAPPTPPRRFAPWLPENANNVILQCLAKSPEDRPRDAVEVANRLFELQFCAGSSVALDENSTEPTLCTLATLVSAAEREEASRSSRSIGSSTARGMTPPPMEGRSLELAPAGSATAPLRIAVAPAPTPGTSGASIMSPTKPVAGAAWPVSHPAPVVVAPHEEAALVQRTGDGVASSISSLAPHPDEPVVTISRRTMRRVAVAVPLVLLVGASGIVAPFVMKGRAASSPASQTSISNAVASSAPPPPTPSGAASAPLVAAPSDSALVVAPPPASSSSAAPASGVAAVPVRVVSTAGAPPSGSPRPAVVSAAPPEPWAIPPPQPSQPKSAKPAPDDGHDLLQ